MNPDRDPFDANQAIPTLLFATTQAQRLVEQTIPTFRVRNVDWQSLLAYPLSGGFQKWSLIPGALVESMLGLERRAPLFVRKHLAFRMIVVLERI
jgi:hypothetical protein